MIWGKRRADRNGSLGGAGAERAIIDIGSNTVRLVVYGGTMRAPTVLLNEKVTAKPGREIAATGRLADEAMALAMRGLRRFALLLADLGIKDIETVATATVSIKPPIHKLSVLILMCLKAPNIGPLAIPSVQEPARSRIISSLRLARSTSPKTSLGVLPLNLWRT